MLKLLLCMTIIGSSLAVGIYLSSRLDRRVRILSAYITLLQEVAAKMRYTADHLAGLFQENFADYPFSEREPFDRQFVEMTKQYKDALTADDLNLLADFARDLGAGDTESQISRIRLYLSLLDERLDAAREDVRQKGRLYRILPLSVGIVAAILLI